MKQVSFMPTPKMSSYLFVLTAGELERLTAQADGVAISVVTTTGKRQQGRFALDSAVALLRYFNDYFGVKYPLPKLDLIAVPGGFGGAMENWGGITFFESRLLFDPASSAAAAQRGIFSILAHEMAHQWFGNLVTMGWWDNLWLNEGFASWMQAKAAEHFHPQWRTWLNSSGQKQFAMTLDAQRTSHPIQQPVANETEAMAVFDGITYSKGQALIRMLEHYLGEDCVPRRHPQIHGRPRLRQHHYRRSVAGAGGGLRQAGGDRRRHLHRAGRLAAGGRRGDVRRRRAAHRAAPGPLHRPRPRCGAATLAGAGRDRSVARPAPGRDRAAAGSAAEIAAGRCGEPVKLNLGDIGYYRVEYDAASRAALAKSLALMAPADRVNLLADSWALVEAGRAEPASYLELIEDIGTDDNRAVWEQVDPRLRAARSSRARSRGKDRDPHLCARQAAPGLRPARLGRSRRRGRRRCVCCARG